MAKPKEYPFECVRLKVVDGCGTWGYYSKGHHPPHMLVDAVMEEHGEWIPVGRVQHTWARIGIVSSLDTGWAHSLLYASGENGKRGVFPVTVVEL